MRVFLSVLVLTGVAACSPPVPDSAEGVGFNDYDSYLSERQAREKALLESRRQTVQPPEATETPQTPATTVRPATPTQVQQPQPQPPAQPQPQAQAQAPVQTSQPQPATTPAANNPSISDEQDFAAVSSRETIESDRERLKRQRDQYQQFEPTAVPTRTVDGRPNIVEYALNSRNQPGQSIYRRSGFKSASSNQRNCAKYGSPDIAQEAFLANGGPKRDRENLDPDGDGFACGWDPAPYRNAVKR